MVNPALLLFVPLAFMLVALQPRQTWLVMIALVLLATTFTGEAGGSLWWFGRGWALIVSAWFVLAIALMPGTGVLSRALAAVGGSVASVGLLFLTNRGGWLQLDWTIERQIRDGAADVVALMGSWAKDKTWSEDLVKAANSFTDFQANTYPAMLAIASLAGLTVAWWLWRRLTVQEPQPLSPLREFRFRDELIWLVVLGAVLVVMPLEAAGTRAGTNLLAFMGALYVVRGLAVILALFGSPGLIGSVFGVLLVLLLYPLVMATTFMVGITDTWLDLRARRLTRQDNEKH